MRQKTIDRAKPQMKNKRMDQEAKTHDPQNEAGLLHPLKPQASQHLLPHTLDAAQCQHTLDPNKQLMNSNEIKLPLYNYDTNTLISENSFF